MDHLMEIYNLKNDTNRIKMIQEASFDKKSNSGFKIENELLFGTKEWFKAIDLGLIQKFIIKGIISNVYITGHNDYPEFEIENNEGRTIWTRMGIDSAYIVGKDVELSFINQYYKRPSDGIGVFSKCVFEIKIAK